MSVFMSALAADAFDEFHSKADANAIDSPIARTPDISVVVPTYRRPAMLERCLASLLTQDYDPARFEIIVCDDGPDDATRASVERISREHAANGPCVHYVPVTATQGPAGARNAGWRLSRAASIAFTDDDTQPDARWLSSGVKALARGAGAVSGRIIVPLGSRPTDYETDAAGLAHAEFATANAFMDRAALERIGGFDARFTSAWREDSDLQFGLMEAGFPIARADDAIVLHPVRPARWGVSLSQQKKSQFDALLYKKYPLLYKRRIRRGPPLLYYAIVIAVVILFCAAVLGHARIAGYAAAAWLAMTAWFCVKRLSDTSRAPAHVIEMACTSVLIPFLSIYWRLYGAFKFRVFFL
ncbi:glycosyltransferase [Caballeronia sp. dw_19]|uniref:glycosyltransferase n=1 Tax=Caballeronia sp. dw_19 TaxID=2719791 RepID=UPI002105A9E7|nr:glycosyltransferase [Caballeronia sp. dw_19]